MARQLYVVDGKEYPEATSPDEAYAMHAEATQQATQAPVAPQTQTAPGGVGSYMGATDPRGPLNAEHLKNLAGSAGVGLHRTIGQIGQAVGVPGATEELARLEEAGKKFNDPAGQFVGEAVGLAPVGGAVGAPLRALSKAVGLAKFSPSATRAISAAAEGGAEGGIVGGQEGAGEGAGISAGLSMLPAAARRFLSKGIVKSSPEAEEAIRWASGRAGQRIDLPLGQKAEGGVTKWLYKNVLPLAPWAGGALQRQSAKAAAQWRRRTLQEIADMGGMGNLADNIGEAGKIEVGVEDIKAGLKSKIENTVKKYDALAAPDDPRIFAQKRFEGKDEILDDDIDMALSDLENELDKHVKMGNIKGREVVAVRNALLAKADKAGTDSLEQAYREAAESMTDLVESQLITDKTRRHMEDLAAGRKPKKLTDDEARAMQDFGEWQRAAEGERRLVVIDRAVKDATSQKRAGAYEVGDLEKAYKGRVVEGGELVPEIKHGRSSVGRPLSEQSIAGKRTAIAATALAGGSGIPFGVGLPVAAGVLGSVGLGRLAATKGAQKFLMGDLSGQLAMERGLRRWAKPIGVAGALGRAGAVGQYADEEEQ